MSAAPLFVHATALVVGETGILIEGASGSGKSSFADALIVEAGRAGHFGRLVGDDRIGLTALHGRLVARPHPALAGLIERRGTGLVRVPYEPACVVALVVALVEEVERLPERPPLREVLGIGLPLLRLRVAEPPGEQARRLLLTRPPLAPRCVHSF